MCTDEGSHSSAEEQGLSVESAIPACIYLLYGLQLSGWDIVWVDHDLVRSCAASICFGCNIDCLVRLRQLGSPGFELCWHSCFQLHLQSFLSGCCLSVNHAADHSLFMDLQEGPDSEEIFSVKRLCLEAWHKLLPIMLRHADDREVIEQFKGTRFYIQAASCAFIEHPACVPCVTAEQMVVGCPVRVSVTVSSPGLASQGSIRCCPAGMQP